VEIARTIPQGLKPPPHFATLMARLKLCPGYKAASMEFFRSL
jgi:hypothetical protein